MHVYFHTLFNRNISGPVVTLLELRNAKCHHRNLQNWEKEEKTPPCVVALLNPMINGR